MWTVAPGARPISSSGLISSIPSHPIRLVPCPHPILLNHEARTTNHDGSSFPTSPRSVCSWRSSLPNQLALAGLFHLARSRLVPILVCPLRGSHISSSHGLCAWRHLLSTPGGRQAAVLRNLEVSIIPALTSGPSQIPGPRPQAWVGRQIKHLTHNHLGHPSPP